jgi:hypothetical protein
MAVPVFHFDAFLVLVATIWTGLLEQGLPIPMAKVFLSHSSRDNEAAMRLKAWLDEQGLTPAFLDFDRFDGIPAGANWEKTLYRKIKDCQALLILQTPNWTASRWCFAEFIQARALGKPIFQVVESDAGAAEPPIAADLQRLDLRLDRSLGLEQLKRDLVEIALQDQGGFPWPPPGEPDRPPFPGLMWFGEADAAVFFGRDEDWRTVIERLRGRRRLVAGPRLLVLQGASGSGKSSLLRAGVLPRLRRAGREWLVLPPLRPRAQPLQALAQGLAVALARPGDWRGLLHQLLANPDPTELGALLAGWVADLRVAAGAPEAQILLPIDQGEELFTVAEEQECQRFLEVLAAALTQPLPLQALMTIRADAMSALQSLPMLANTFETLPLGPLSIDRYREIIEGPARVVGLTVEPAFVERAIRDTATEDALPLLAFALKELHCRFGTDGLLTLDDYQSLGDGEAGLSPLENAVRLAAYEALNPTPSASALQALRDAFLPAMVNVSEQGTFTRRAADWDLLPVAARPLLDALVSARLLVRRRPEGERSTVEVTHEALLRVWPLLRGWLEDSRDFLVAIDQIKRDHVQWRQSELEATGDASLLLLRGAKLDKARRWLRERPEAISSDLKHFIAISIRQERIRVVQAAGTKAGFLVLIALGVIGAFGWVRLNPSLYANLLTTKASLTGSTADIEAALKALHEHRRRLLIATFPEAGSTENNNVSYGAFNCSKTTQLNAEFCASERHVVQLLQMDHATYPLKNLKKMIDTGRFGQRYYDPPMAPFDKRFTPGALRDTVVLLFDAKGAGADLPDGRTGLIDSEKEVWMIPCRLLMSLEAWWRKATAQQCSLFRQSANGSYDYSETYDEKCTAIRTTPSPEDKNSFDTMRTLGYWFFDAQVPMLAKRYEYCSASFNGLNSIISSPWKP